jgi:hypothetical protein
MTGAGKINPARAVRTGRYNMVHLLSSETVVKEPGAGWEFDIV